MYDQKLHDRLAARVKIDEKGCWIWQGAGWYKRKWPQNRYGMTHIAVPGSKRAKTIGAHRAMLIAMHGPLTPQQCACHRCDVPRCINPDHLFVGTMRDNIHDSRRKGRHYESRKDYCDRGHPLFGDNLYSPKGKNGKLKRVCRKCQLGKCRREMGWPEYLWYSDIKIPYGWMMDRATWTPVPIDLASFRKRKQSSASEGQS